MKEYKWHYFNEEDCECNKVFTMCGKRVLHVKRHTEHKNSVTCLQCLHYLNQRDGLNK